MRHTHFFTWRAYRKPYWKCSWNIQHILWFTSSFKQRDVGGFLVGFEGRWSIYYFFDSQIFNEVLYIFPRLSCRLMHQSIPRAPSLPSPGLLRGICPPCQSQGWGICKFCTAQGPGICQPRGHSRAFDTHAVSYHNITTQKVLLEKKQISSSVKDRNKFKRVVKACSRFYAWISSMLIKPGLHSEIGAIDVKQRFLVIESNFCWCYLKNILSYL